MTKHDNADKDKAPNYDEAMESLPFSLVSPSTKSKADTSQDTLDDTYTSESKNRPLHECDDMDKCRTEKDRNNDTSKKKRKCCCICMGCLPCCGGACEENVYP